MATVAKVDSFSVGGWVLTGEKLNRLKILHVQTQLFGTFRVNGATSGYVVPASTEFVIIAAAIVTRTGAIGSGCMKLGYGDNDVGQNSASAPTTPILAIGGNVGDGCFSSGGAHSEFRHSNFPIVAIGGQASSFYFVVPAGKFPYMNTDQNSTAVCWGYERSV
jgi:hypothetical protein